jgi:hypothetical protein
MKSTFLSTAVDRNNFPSRGIEPLSLSLWNLQQEIQLAAGCNFPSERYYGLHLKLEEGTIVYKCTSHSSNTKALKQYATRRLPFWG